MQWINIPVIDIIGEYTRKANVKFMIEYFIGVQFTVVEARRFTSLSMPAIHRMT